MNIEALENLEAIYKKASELAKQNKELEAEKKAIEANDAVSVDEASAQVAELEAKQKILYSRYILANEEAMATAAEAYEIACSVLSKAIKKAQSDYDSISATEFEKVRDLMGIDTDESQKVAMTNTQRLAFKKLVTLTNQYNGLQNALEAMSIDVDPIPLNCKTVAEARTKDAIAQSEREVVELYNPLTQRSKVADKNSRYFYYSQGFRPKAEVL